MRHPLRRVATQGAWYALGNGLVKVSGLLLLPILTNTRYLSMADYGRWGVFEVTVQIAVAILGLSLPIGLVRFYSEPRGGSQALSAGWWLTAALGIAAALLGAIGILSLVPPSLQVIYALLLAYVVFEMLLAVPLALLRAEERAGRYTTVLALKLTLLVSLSLWLMAGRSWGLPGLIAACAGASGLTLLIALFAARRREFILPRLPRETARTLLRFSVPLVIGGLGSMVLSAGGRYVLALFRSPEDVALYTLAGRFGGVVNMFVVQPFNLAWLPLLFRLHERQRPEVLRLLLPYLTFALCAITVGLSLLAAPALRIMKSAPSYGAAVPLIPWISLGFAAYGLSTVFGGVMALFQRTRALSLWLILAAGLNLGLNFLLVPWLGPLAAAINTLIAYGALLVAQYLASQRLLPNRYPRLRLCGVGAVTLAVALLGALRPATGSLTDWIYRLALLCGWVVVLVVTRWFSVAEVREAWRVMRGSKTADVPGGPGPGE